MSSCCCTIGALCIFSMFICVCHRYNRDWRYHKEERVWITRAPGMEPIVKTSTYERGTYYYFDVQNWRKVPKEFHLEYDLAVPEVSKGRFS